MRRWVIGLSSFILLVAALYGSLRYFYRAEFAVAATERLQEELGRVVISLRLQEATLTDAVKIIEREARQAGLRKDVRFDILMGLPEGVQFRRCIDKPAPVSPVIPGLEEIHTVNSAKINPFEPAQPLSPDQSRITLVLPQTTVLEANQYVAGLSDYYLRYTDDDAVQFIAVPRNGTCEPLLRRHFKVPRGFMRSFVGTRDGDPCHFLTENGTEFYEGTASEYDENAGVLTVVNTKEQLDWIEMLIAPNCSLRPATWHEKALWWVQSRMPWNRPPPTPPTVASPMSSSNGIPVIPGLETPATDPAGTANESISPSPTTISGRR